MENLLYQNPIMPGNELWDRGQPEVFKLIYFWDIKPIYYISSYGRIFSVSSGKQMCPVQEGTGYLRIILRTNDNSRKSFKMHRLVTMAFIPKTIEDIQRGRDIVNHKNLIKWDNYVGNLEWCTDQENTIHAHQHSMYFGMPNPINRLNERESGWGLGVLGEDVGLSRLTEEQVHLICQALQNGLSYEDCCYAAGLENTSQNRNVICNIKAGRRWQHISCQYNIQKEMRELKDLTSYVIPVCELLQNGGMTIKAIVEYLQIPGSYDSARMFVSGIKNRKTYTNISKDYKF